MKLLPREHGATTIWFSSLLFAFGTLREQPWIPAVLAFLAASVLALFLVGRLTRGSIRVARLERNSILLPVLSGLLTLIAPFGEIVMVGQISLHILAAWVVFMTYCSCGVVYTRDSVRSVLNEAPPAWTSFILSAVILAAEIVTLNAIDWLSIIAVAAAAPLIVHRAIVLSLIQRRSSSKARRIRGVGFAQAGNLIATVIILALASRF